MMTSKNTLLRSLASVLLLSLMLPVRAGDTKPQGQTPQKLSLKEFVVKASTNDVGFEAILLDRLSLQYRRDVLLPERDIILQIKQQMHFFEGGRRDGSSAISLSKLFPDTGTRLSATYDKGASLSGNDTASMQVLIAQPLAQNAFGKAIQLQDSLIGVENQISHYQIVEAYEDYLAALTTVWYNWYSAFENLKVARTAVQSGERLLKNILERQRQKIALPVDVNKMKLSLIAKKENRVVLQEIYDNLSNLVYSAMRYRPVGQAGNGGFVPDAPGDTAKLFDFEQEYEHFVSSSRTYAILNLLDKQAGLALDQVADDLLPSTELLLAYDVDAQEWGTGSRDNRFTAGIAVSWPIGRRVDKARYEIEQLQRKKTRLSNQSKLEDLRTNLGNLYLQIQREQELMEISQQKIQLAQAVLKDEKENYSFGKISLNDYISAVNNVDENRFSYTRHVVQLNKLMLEWMRLADRLVDEKEIIDVSTH
ncbi:MAG: TolC family protein [Gammaproteobacteria bacterium]|nr:TolC family protein [Gammaproteobacteria bacterium]MDH5802600.1 TolC family protein [Gammaproteobacteria bacterium]